VKNEIKIVIHGSQGAGKSQLARQLNDFIADKVKINGKNVNVTFKDEGKVLSVLAATNAETSITIDTTNLEPLHA
jgi:signal recognition particle receptor subunit beta